ncbi:MAG: carbon storage regulator CsrA [Gemmatales bacterium]
MLVLTRKVTETIVIDSDVKVTVLGVKGNAVRIGIDAPPHVAIRRDELEPEINYLGAAVFERRELAFAD